MNLEEKEIWSKIVDFELDDTTASFTFTDRLCRDNNWSMEYAVRSILEYKKFIFLIVTTKNAQTPSDQIDQVWHLHLLYTISYWKEFCSQLLNTEIHHGPTKGIEEKQNYLSAYTKTLACYKKVFGPPPRDIWPSPNDRMKNINFVRVNRKEYWIKKKRLFLK